MSHSSPEPVPSEGRTDLERTDTIGYVDVLCTRCRRLRTRAHEESPPAPGECTRCRSRDPRRYWRHDWEKTHD